MNTQDLYWVAGILEGEGCFSLRPPSGTSKIDRISVQVRMTDLDVLESIQRIIGLGNITGPEIKEKGKPIWVWQISKQTDVASVMMTVYPLMYSRRREKIRECLNAWMGADQQNPNFCRKGHRKQPGKRCIVCVNGHDLLYKMIINGGKELVS